MITITGNAKKKIFKMRIDSLYISLRYIKGPCDDNLCKLIPVVVVSTTPTGVEYVLINEEGIKIYVQKIIFEKIKKQDEDVFIDYSFFRGGFFIKNTKFSL